MINIMFKINLCFWVILLFSLDSIADLGHRNIPLFQPKRLQISIEAQSFKTDENFIAGGEKEVLPPGFEFVTYDLIVSSMYDFSDDLAASLDLNLSYAESFNNVSFRNNREIKDLKIGLYKLYDLKKFGQIVVDGFYLLNFTDNDVDKDEVSVSDGISWFQVGAWWQPPKAEYFLEEKDLEYKQKYGKKSSIQPTVQAYAGFRSRPDYSDLLILKLQPRLKIHKYIIGAEFNGMFSIIKEGDSKKVEKALLNQRYNASSFRYNAWNPTVHEVYLWFGFQPNTYSQFRFGASQVLGNENTADGMGFFFEWQTSMIATASGMIFSNFFDRNSAKNPKKNTDMRIKNYGPEPKETPKVKPSDLQDL